MPAGSATTANAARTPVVDRAASWRVSLALVASFAIVTSGLRTVLDGFGWWFALCGIAVAVLGVPAVVRALSRRKWMPTAAAVAALVATLTMFFFASSAFLFVIPTFETWGHVGELIQAGSLSIASQSTPAEVTFGIMFLLCLGVAGLAVVADLLAVTLRWPALAGVPLLVVLAIPASVGLDLSDGYTFAMAAVAFLVLLRAGQPLRQTGRSVALGASAVTLALVLPLVLPAVDVSEAEPGAFSGYVAGVNPVLNLGDDLRRDVPRTVLNYSTLSGAADYLRLVSLQNFTAKTWEPDPPDIDENNRPSAVGAPPGLAPTVEVQPETTWVDVNNLGSPWLPVPYPATSVSGLTGNWFWDAEALTFTSPDRTSRGEEYRVQSLKVKPTPTQLENAGTVLPPGYDKYLKLPSALPAIISTTANQVTSGTTSNYAKALALQEFFRDGEFGYSETAPGDEGYDGTGMEVLAKFLVAKSGYCIHFASAMAVMARVLGIPSRVAVGFLPGEKSGEQVRGRDSYRVTTQNLHAWPELYFEGIGWTRFEPTPGRGTVPVYADEANPDVPAPPTVPTPQPTETQKPTSSATAPATPVDQNDASASGTPTQSILGGLWVVVSILGVVLLLLIPAIVRVVQRRVRLRRLAKGAPSATTGWRELLQTAIDLGIRIDSADTPRDAAAVIAQHSGLHGAGADSLASVLSFVEHQSFARPGAAARAQQQASQLTLVLGELRAGVGACARLRAALAPRSIWSRIGVFFAGSASNGQRAATAAG